MGTRLSRLRVHAHGAADNLELRCCCDRTRRPRRVLLYYIDTSQPMPDEHSESPHERKAQCSGDTNVSMSPLYPVDEGRQMSCQIGVR